MIQIITDFLVETIGTITQWNYIFKVLGIPVTQNFIFSENIFQDEDEIKTLR